MSESEKGGGNFFQHPLWIPSRDTPFFHTGQFWEKVTFENVNFAKFKNLTNYGKKS